MRKTIVITGASSGIGRETTRLFSARGWNVAATMRFPDKETDLGSLPNVKLYRLDLSKAEELDSIPDAVRANFATIDVLFNNAGYGAVGAFEKSSEEQMRQQFEVNVFGVMNLTRKFIPVFRTQGHGIIINTSSVVGRFTIPLYSLYCSSKWALEGFSEALQYELSQFNIQMKILEPAAIRTDFHGRSLEVFQDNQTKGYEQMEHVILTGMRNRNKKAAGPEIVAKTAFRAAQDRSSKMRYPVGKGSRLVLAARRLLPTSWFNRMVFRQQSRKS